MLVYGLMQKEVAETLKISIKTVQKSSTLAYRKMNVRNITGATKYCVEHKIIDVDHWLKPSGGLPEWVCNRI